MRGSTARRLIVAGLFALLAGLLVALINPVDRVKADLRTDTQGVRHSLDAVGHDL